MHESKLDCFPHTNFQCILRFALYVHPIRDSMYVYNISHSSTENIWTAVSALKRNEQDMKSNFIIIIVDVLFFSFSICRYFKTKWHAAYRCLTPKTNTSSWEWHKTRQYFIRECVCVCIEEQKKIVIRDNNKRRQTSGKYDNNNEYTMLFLYWTL